jgi:hypothetical protein
VIESSSCSASLNRSVRFRSATVDKWDSLSRHEIGVDVTREMSMEKDWLAEGAAAQALKCC